MRTRKSLGLAAVAVVTVVLLAGCKSRSTVDTKLELNLPDGKGTCYLLEIDQENGAGASEGENFYCVPKAEWDKNRQGEHWVDANGKRK